MKVILSLACTILVLHHAVAQGLKDNLPQGKYFGTAVNNQYLEGNHGSNPSGYNTALVNDFNCIVAENAFKMSYLLPNRPADPFNVTIDDFSAQGLARVDALLALADQEGMRVRGHAYIWYNQAPAWLNNEASGWTNQQIYDFAESYIMAFGGYTKGKVDEWDVVNEAINDDAPSGYRTGTWYDAVSDVQDFIDHCFNAARLADPASALFYNDYNIETTYQTKRDFMLSMVSGMVNRSVAIDGVGLQSHFVSGPNMNSYVMTEVSNTIDAVGALGLVCNITELDLRICGGTDQAALNEQGDEFKAFTELFLNKVNCNSLLVWGISDNGSWIPYTFDGCDDALLYDDNMNKKPGYFGVEDALTAVPSGDNEPYSGSPIAIPGIIQMEDYDLGGEGVAYSDVDAGNEGGNYRSDNVDIAGTGDQGGGAVVGWISAGEWLEYTVDVESEGLYDFTFRVTSALDGGKFKVLLNNVVVIPEVNAVNTGGWEAYTDVEVKDIQLVAGENVMRFEFDAGAFNFNYTSITKSLVTGLKDQFDVDVYPNPVTSLLHLTKASDWVLYNALGQKIDQGRGEEVAFDVYKKGVYFIKVNNHMIKLLK